MAPVVRILILRRDTSKVSIMCGSLMYFNEAFCKTAIQASVSLALCLT
jgi:hypothetical protein